MAQIRGHLTLIGENFDLPFVSQTLGVTPTWQKKAGDILGNGKAFGHCEWGVSTESFNTDDFSVVADALVNVSPSAYGAMVEIAKKTNSNWHILFSIDASGEFPVIVLSPLFSKFASEIGAEIGFDIA